MFANLQDTNKYGIFKGFELTQVSSWSANSYIILYNQLQARDSETPCDPNGHFVYKVALNAIL